MITRHHVALAGMSSLVLLCAFAPYSLLLTIPVAFGACTGAVLPDIQMKRPPGHSPRILAFFLVRYTRRICVPVLAAVYRKVFGISVDPSDKRITHSLPGISGIFLCSGAIVCFPVIVLIPIHMGFAVLGFLAGLSGGLVLHLVGDLCTRKGITPLFPFSGTRISGTIRPCDKADCRIARYHAYHGIAMIGIPGLAWTGSIPVPALPSLGIATLFVCTGAMVLFSDVGIDRGNEPDIHGCLPGRDGSRNTCTGDTLRYLCQLRPVSFKPGFFR